MQILNDFEQSLQVLSRTTNFRAFSIKNNAVNGKRLKLDTILHTCLVRCWQGIKNSQGQNTSCLMMLLHKVDSAGRRFWVQSGNPPVRCYGDGYIQAMGSIMLQDVNQIYPNLNKVVGTKCYPLWGECLGVDRQGGQLAPFFEKKMKQYEKHVSI